MKSNLLSHVLAVEFPELAESIHYLKMHDTHFEKLMNEHDKIDLEITKSEEGIGFLDDQAMKELKVKRLHLKETLQQAAIAHKKSSH